MTNFFSWVFDGGLKPDMPRYLDLFDRQDFDSYGGNYGDCRNHIHLLSPDMYLALCEPIPADDMTRHADLEKKFKFPVPFKDRVTPFVLPDDARKAARKKELKEGK